MALGMVLVADGDYEAAVLGGVNYGRDADSIASMAGAICGCARRDERRCRADWADRGRRGESRRSWTPAGETIAGVAARRVREGRPARRAPARTRRAGLVDCGRGPSSMSRLTWVQPPDLLTHELVASADEGKDVDDVRRRWVDGGRARRTPRRPGSASRATTASVPWRFELLDELETRAARPGPRWPRARRPGRDRGTWSRPPGITHVSGDLDDRMLGRLARPRRRLPARQAGGEDPARGHPGDPPGAGPLAAAPTGSPRGTCPADVRPAGRGTGGARRPAWPRTSTGCPRTTTSTSRCWRSSCSSGTAPELTTEDVADSLAGRTFRLGACSPPNGSPTATCCSATTHRADRDPSATRSGSGSARRSAPTPTAGRIPETRPRPPGWPGGTPG